MSPCAFKYSQIVFSDIASPSRVPSSLVRRIESLVVGDLLRPGNLLRLLALCVADVDKREQPVQMPFLALKWDTVADHPVVDDFSSYFRFAGRTLLHVVKGGGRHGSVDIGFYLPQNSWSDCLINRGVHILRQGHAPDVVNGLLHRSSLL